MESLSANETRPRRYRSGNYAKWFILEVVAQLERMNGIIKSEFNLYESRIGFEATSQLITTSINAYNHLRPHSSCDFLTPEQAHQQKGLLNKRWKNYYNKNMEKPIIYEVADSDQVSKIEAARLPLTEQAPASVLRTAAQSPTFEKEPVR